MQAEIAGAIAKALELPLGIGGDAALVSERSADQQAYAMYLQARAAYRARGDGVKKSIELYRAALKRDPKFAPAWAGLASSLAVLPWYVPEAEKAAAAAAMPEAEAAGKQALALAPDLSQGHNALAMVYSFQWQWALAEQHSKQALALAPTDPDMHYQYSDWLSATGRLEEALKSASKAVELDPLVPIFLNGKANSLERLGRNEEGLRVRQAAYALAPDVGLFRNNLFRSYLRTDRLDELEKLLDQDRAAALARAKRNGGIGDPQRLPRAFIRLKRNPDLAESIRKELGDKDFQFMKAWIGDDIDARFKGLTENMNRHYSGVDPVAELRSFRYADYRKDPRYIRLLNKAGFDDEGKIR
jgi:tetratricopeptide (TPR) repeat protein